MIPANNLANWETLLRFMAQKHPMIRHDQLDSSNRNRVCFFRWNQEWELKEAIVNEIDFPAIVHTGYVVEPYSFTTGKLRKRTTVTIQILECINEGHFTTTLAEQMHDALVKCETICEDIINYLEHQVREEGCLAKLFSFSAGDCAYTYIEPLPKQLVGYELTLVASGKFETNYNPSLWQ